MTKPRVSIITVNYRQAAVTCALLDSLAANSYREHLEIIVVDNGALEDSTALFKQHHPSVKVIVSPENLGFAGGNNLGIRAATGDFLFLVNNDTVFTDGLVENTVRRFVTNPQIGAVSPKIRYFYTPQYIQYAGFTEINILTGRNKTIGKNEQDNGQHDTARPTPYAHGAAMMLRREVIDRVGFMPEEYFLYYEELDWCAQMRRAGFTIWYEPSGVIYHKESASVGKMSALKMRYQTRNRLLFMRRNQSQAAFIFFLCYFFSVTVPINSVRLLLSKQRSLFLTFIQSITEGLSFSPTFLPSVAPLPAPHSEYVQKTVQAT